VDKTGCFKLAGRIIEAGAVVVGEKVVVRYDPYDLAIMEIWHKGQKITRQDNLSPNETKKETESGIQTNYLISLAKRQTKNGRNGLGPSHSGSWKVTAVYESFFGFTKAPFSRDIELEQLFKFPGQRELMSRSIYVVERRLFGLITGEDGSGKTTAIPALGKELPVTKYRMIIYVTGSNLTPRNFY
jgi:hypothetical protein